MEELFQRWASSLALMVEALAVIFITVGAIEAVWMMVKTPREGRRKAVLGALWRVASPEP